MNFTKIQEKNRYYIYCMNANADVYIKEIRKRALPDLRGGDDGSTCRFIVLDVFCSLWLSSFLFFIDIAIAIYRML